MVATQNSRESWLYEAKMAYLAERFDEAVDLLVCMVAIPPTVTSPTMAAGGMGVKSAISESKVIRNSLENELRRLRTVLRNAVSLCDPARRSGLESGTISAARGLLSKFQTELAEACRKGISICQTQLGMDVVAKNAFLFAVYHKCLGDCYRYLEDAPEAIKAYQAVLSRQADLLEVSNSVAATSGNANNSDDESCGLIVLLGAYLGIGLVQMELEGNRLVAIQTLKEGIDIGKKSQTKNHDVNLYYFRMIQNVREWEEIDHDAAADADLAFPNDTQQVSV